MNSPPKTPTFTRLIPRKVAVRFFLLFFGVVMLLFTGIAVWSISEAFAPHQTTSWRLLLLAAAAALLFLPVKTGFILLFRRLTKGQWSTTEEERLRLREHYASSAFTAKFSRSMTVLWSLILLLHAAALGIDLWKRIHHSEREIAYTVLYEAVMVALCVWNLRFSLRRLSTGSRELDA